MPQIEHHGPDVLHREDKPPGWLNTTKTNERAIGSLASVCEVHAHAGLPQRQNEEMSTLAMYPSSR